LDHVSRRGVTAIGGQRQSFLEIVGRCERDELWMDSRSNDQLVLIWLLTHLRPRPEVATKIMLRHIDTPLFDGAAETTWTFVGVQLTREHLDIAQRAWQAFRSRTPQAWFDLLKQDLSALPQLRSCVQEMLEELPGVTTGLGASELRILELLSAGYRHPFELFRTVANAFNGAFMISGKSARCWTVWRWRRSLQSRASPNGHSRSNRTTALNGSTATRPARCH
jgi:hypothetical protein